MNIRNDGENRKKLVEAVVASMDHDEMVKWVKSRLTEEYREDNDGFQADWQDTFGK